MHSSWKVWMGRSVSFTRGANMIASYIEDRQQVYMTTSSLQRAVASAKSVGSQTVLVWTRNPRSVSPIAATPEANVFATGVKLKIRVAKESRGDSVWPVAMAPVLAMGTGAASQCQLVVRSLMTCTSARCWKKGRKKLCIPRSTSA